MVGGEFRNEKITNTSPDKLNRYLLTNGKIAITRARLIAVANFR